ncbi:MAG: hypothetical protein IID44_04925 [Planctomycetes bacterium]|nr:hypothetical protein [Planctomycetota bacterium]
MSKAKPKGTEPVWEAVNPDVQLSQEAVEAITTLLIEDYDKQQSESETTKGKSK